MVLSIITVNYNNPEGLARTINSVITQNRKDFEYIIVDGASNKGDIDIIHKYSRCITKWISEPDTGIYNAMNKAVSLSTGDYCLFLNSGDTLYCNTTIDEIYNSEFNEDFVEGRIKTGNYISTAPEDYTLGSYFWKRNNFHQGCLIKRTLLLKHPYDENYRIASDFKFNIETIVVNNCTYKPINIIISNYEQGGLSSRVSHRDEIDSIYRDFFPPRVIKDYTDNYYLYDYPAKLFMPFVSWLGHSYMLYYLKILVKKTFKIDIRDSEYYELQRRKKG